MRPSSTAPRSSSPSSSMSSPSLLRHLNQFKYENKEKKKKRHDVRPEKSEVIVVPETSESELESPVFRPSKKKLNVALISDSDSDSEGGSCDNNNSVDRQSPLNSIPTTSSKHNISSSDTPVIKKRKRIQLIDSDDDGSGVDEKRQKQNSCLVTSSDSESENKSHSIVNGAKTSTCRGVQFISDDSNDAKSDISVSWNEGKVTSVYDCEEPVSSFKRKDVVYKDEEPISSSKNKGVVFIDDDESETKSQGNEDEVDLVNGDGATDDGRLVYDSDYSDSEETDQRLAVLSYFNEATLEELLCVRGFQEAKAELIISKRPFKNWAHLVCKITDGKTLRPSLLNNAQEVIKTRNAVLELMHKCEKLSQSIEKTVNKVMEGKKDAALTKQPSNLNSSLTLAPYQMVGLNWLALIHKHKLNGILADEMGLGKTIQAIAFLAYLLQAGNHGPHLIVVPSSTIENWIREITLWCKNLDVLVYFGSQEERREMRYDLLGKGRNKLHYNVVITTYNLVSSSVGDRNLMKSLKFHYVIFDEAHMLKNMATQRYKNLMKIQASRRLLLTGTPLQNNLVELMSLLIFVMPDVFEGKTEQVLRIFGASVKSNEPTPTKSKFEQQRIEQAKRIMQPFVLRRLKTNVLKDLPKKLDKVEKCNMTTKQRELYDNMIAKLTKQVKENKEKLVVMTGLSMMMMLRKLANHPLLMRNHYTDKLLRKMSKLMLKEPTHRDASADLIYEDMEVMSDFELHRLCCTYKNVKKYCLQQEHILDSGKFIYLKSVLKSMRDAGDRVLLFSQFTMMLDIVEEFLNILGYKFIRLDGQTPVTERQDLIDKFSTDHSIFIFLLSTRAGGLGINLTAANHVILHDIDSNPYNDKQAEDRCHRVGQKREVTITRLLCTNSIEEGMFQCAKNKLQLEKDITGTENDSAENTSSVDIISLLKTVLGL